MTCFQCGAANPSVYLQGEFGQGEPQQRAYCLVCFDLGDFPEQIKRTLKNFEIRVRGEIPVPGSQRGAGHGFLQSSPKCVKCGASGPSVRMVRTTSGVPGAINHCETCHGQIIGTEQRISVLLHDHLTASSSAHFKTLKSPFDHMIGRATQLCSRFPRDAHTYVLKASFYALLKGSVPSPLGLEQPSARELVEAAELYAVETWGPSAKSVLKLWGIESAANLGALVFHLVEVGLLRPRQGQRLSDFDSLPFLEP